MRGAFGIDGGDLLLGLGGCCGVGFRAQGVESLGACGDCKIRGEKCESGMIVGFGRMSCGSAQRFRCR